MISFRHADILEHLKSKDAVYGYLSLGYSYSDNAVDKVFLNRIEFKNKDLSLPLKDDVYMAVYESLARIGFIDLPYTRYIDLNSSYGLDSVMEEIKGELQRKGFEVGSQILPQNKNEIELYFVYRPAKIKTADLLDKFSPIHLGYVLEAPDNHTLKLRVYTKPKNNEIEHLLWGVFNRIGSATFGTMSVTVPESSVWNITTSSIITAGTFDTFKKDIDYTFESKASEKYTILENIPDPIGSTFKILPFKN